MTSSRRLKDKKLPTKKKSPQYRISQQMVDCMVSDFYGAGLTCAAIAKKYDLHYNTAYRHIKENAHMEEYYNGLKPEPLKKREELPELERVGHIIKDSYSVIEKTLAIINNRLNDEIVAAEKGIKTEPSHKLNLKDLAVVIAEINPYILEKKVPGKKPDGNTKGKGQVFQMFGNKKTS